MAVGDESDDSVMRSPAVATALSFLLPGLGQVVVGRPHRGALVSIPAILVAIVPAWVYLFNRRAPSARRLCRRTCSRHFWWSIVALCISRLGAARAGSPNWRVVPKAGVEPARGCPQRFLRPSRLPVPPLRHGQPAWYSLEGPARVAYAHVDRVGVAYGACYPRAAAANPRAARGRSDRG